MTAGTQNGIAAYQFMCDQRSVCNSVNPTQLGFAGLHTLTVMKLSWSVRDVHLKEVSSKEKRPLYRIDCLREMSTTEVPLCNLSKKFK